MEKGRERVAVVENNPLTMDPSKVKIRRSLAAGEVRSPYEVRRAVELALQTSVPQQ